tara:strand:+ start:853 stop:1257 length:405 start_codon:yes stop_codon:yes gene_type:complete
MVINNFFFAIIDYDYLENLRAKKIFCCLSSSHLNGFIDNNKIRIVKLYDKNNNIIKGTYRHDIDFLYNINRYLNGQENDLNLFIDQEIDYVVDYTYYLRLLQRKIKKKNYRKRFLEYYKSNIRNLLKRQINGNK